jgi:hypothetical protein
MNPALVRVVGLMGGKKVVGIQVNPLDARLVDGLLDLIDLRLSEIQDGVPIVKEIRDRLDDLGLLLTRMGVIAEDQQLEQS